MAGAGKVLAVLVKGRRHHAVGRVEGLLHAVAVVDVNVNVQHARVHLEQLQDAQHAVVDVAKARRLGLFRVVQAAAPVDDNVRLLGVQPLRAAQRARRRQLAKLKQPVKHRAVLAHVEALQPAVERERRAGRGSGAWRARARARVVERARRRSTHSRKCSCMLSGEMMRKKEM